MVYKEYVFYLTSLNTYLCTSLIQWPYGREKIHLNCEKNIVKAFKRDLTNCKLQFVLRLRLLNNSNLTTHNANSLVTSDLPWHKSRNEILNTVHSVIWPYEVNSQFPPPTLTQNPSATLIKTWNVTHKSSISTNR